VIFVVNNDNVSSILRGNHVAEALGVPLCFADLGGARDEDVVFVKEADRGLVLDAVDRGNRIILDVIDLHCYKQRICPFADLVEVLIVPNRACIDYYAKLYPIARFAVIPHQWDHRIHGTAQQYRFTPAYIGKSFNLPLSQDWGGTNVFDSSQHLMAASKFNLHLCLQRRDGLHALLKPATKVSTAAAVLANVLTYRDPSAVELLGVEYPFYVDRDETLAIRMVREAFGGKDWKRGREMMKEVREKTSLQAIAGLYRRLASNDPAMLIEAEAVAVNG
jgi:hypothetical protein